ncbi:hypothetical protein [Streptomyces aureoversilis]|uniref:Uncharacterized protein n=1 Tax=Streptomyces aureoversilis TaxID=67277 RepID=A0ABV9ZS80_9ACTN
MNNTATAANYRAYAADFQARCPDHGTEHSRWLNCRCNEAQDLLRRAAIREQAAEGTR